MGKLLEIGPIVTTVEMVQDGHTCGRAYKESSFEVTMLDRCHVWISRGEPMFFSFRGFTFTDALSFLG